MMSERVVFLTLLKCERKTLTEITHSAHGLVVWDSMAPSPSSFNYGDNIKDDHFY